MHFKINRLWALLAGTFYCLCALTISGDLGEWICFADPLNEMAFAVLCLVAGVLATMHVLQAD